MIELATVKHSVSPAEEVLNQAAHVIRIIDLTQSDDDYSSDTCTFTYSPITLLKGLMLTVIVHLLSTILIVIERRDIYRHTQTSVSAILSEMYLSLLQSTAVMNVPAKACVGFVLVVSVVLTVMFSPYPGTCGMEKYGE